MRESGDEISSHDGTRWWSEGQWTPIPSGMLVFETSPAVLAIDDTEYPALSALIRYAADVDGYLRMLGVSEESISELDDSATSFSEGEETTGLDA